MNALWHGLATVLLVMLLGRWLPPLGAAAAGLVFAWHPVHVEAVASLVGRAELLVAVGILGAGTRRAAPAVGRGRAVRRACDVQQGARCHCRCRHTAR